jgi:hypothetical protein
MMMKKEIEQRQKFVEHFLDLIDNAPEDFIKEWHKEDPIPFYNLTGVDFKPHLSEGVINLLPPDVKKEYEDLESRYYAKAL